MPIDQSGGNPNYFADSSGAAAFCIKTAEQNHPWLEQIEPAPISF
jgi:hypothetical protein